MWTCFQLCWKQLAAPCHSGAERVILNLPTLELDKCGTSRPPDRQPEHRTWMGPTDFVPRVRRNDIGLYSKIFSQGLFSIVVPKSFTLKKYPVSPGPSVYPILYRRIILSISIEYGDVNKLMKANYIISPEIKRYHLPA